MNHITTHVSWHVVTARGLTVYTFDTEAAAREHVQKARHIVPGLVVERVTTTIEYERVYTPRIRAVA